MHNVFKSDRYLQILVGWFHPVVEVFGVGGVQVSPILLQKLPQMLARVFQIGLIQYQVKYFLQDQNNFVNTQFSFIL